MRRAVPALFLFLAACSAGTVDLDVSTSVIDIPTTTTIARASPSTTAPSPPASTAPEDDSDPIVPDVARVIPIRPVLLSDDSGGRRAEFDGAEFAEWVLQANEIFAPARIGFSYDVAEEPAVAADTLVNGIGDPDSPGWVQRVIRGNAIAAAYPGELVVLFTGAPIEKEVGSHHLGFVVMGEPGSELMCGDADPNLLAHRIGLYLGLPHTYAAAHASIAEAAGTLAQAQQERAVFDGDSFDDTLPDPAIHDEHQCEPENPITVGGLEFELPRDNLMSHYRERAQLTLSQVDRLRWVLDSRQANDMAVPINGGKEGALEAEAFLSATGGPCGLGAVEEMSEHIGYQWVDSDHLVFPSSEGCRLEFTIPVPDSGNYEVFVLGTHGPSLGAVEFIVDGEAFLLEDLYAPLTMATGPMSLGMTTIDAGQVVIGVEVVGANALSQGTSTAIDGFVLVLSS